MKPIQMVDLKGQYQPIQKEIDEKVLEVIKSALYINGPEVTEFEDELATYLNIPHVIACANGTDALQVALMSLDLEAGDEIITTDFTFVATAEVIKLLKLKAILVDAGLDTFNIDIQAIEKAITPRTKAIIPVHLFGQCAQMDQIMTIAKKHDLFVIEDTAQALGASYYSENGNSMKAGTIGTIGTTSFFPSKNLSCFGDGGAIFTHDDILAHKIRGIVNHGMYKRYYHDIVGVNSRLDSIQAAILRIKLKRLDQYNDARRKAAEFYTKELSAISSIKTPEQASYSYHVYHQYTLRILDGSRDMLKEHLENHHIPSAIYYPVPLHLQKAYQSHENITPDFPVSTQLAKEVLSLPMHTELDTEQLAYITKTIIDFYHG